MSDTPAPPVPADVDLRGFSFMPLDVGRLLTSETWLLGNGDECKAAVALWCVSWHQVPAASLPSDDKMLAHLSGTGSRWGKVRAHALRGWIKCSDGRLYHPVVAEKAIEAWAKKRKQSDRGKAGAAKRWSGDSTSNGASNAPAMPTPMLVDSNRQGQGQGEENEPTTVPVAARATEPPSSGRPDERTSNADAICQRFLELRERGWPAESRLPSPLMTLRTQALAWLDAGGTVDLCNRVMAETIEKKRANGEPAPTNLGFCRLSMDTAILRHLTEIPAALRREPVSPAEEAYGRAIELWAANGCRGPKPERSEAAA